MRGGGTAKVKLQSACTLSLPLLSACSCAAGGCMLLELGSPVHTSRSALAQGRLFFSTSASGTLFRPLSQRLTALHSLCIPDTNRLNCV